jgi:hypothetical protein
MVIQLEATLGSPTFLDVLDQFQTAITSAPASVGWEIPATFTIENLTGRLGPNHTITLTGSPVVRVSNTADFTVTTPTKTSIVTNDFASFDIESFNGGGSTTTVTIGGQDTIAGAFSFTFTVQGGAN